MKIYSNEDSGNVVFSCNEMGILNIDVKTIIILMKMIVILLFLPYFCLGILNLKNAKHLTER